MEKPSIIKRCSFCQQTFNAPSGSARFCSDQCHFNASHKRVGSCWEWQAGTDKDGYGVVRLSGRRRVKAHRLSYEIHNGSADGQMVCHSCDNPSCVNPAHLFLGNAKENKADCVAKDRHVRGERLYWKAKLTEKDVRQIRSDKRPSREVAEKYAVTPELVQMIRRGKVWKHLD